MNKFTIEKLDNSLISLFLCKNNFRSTGKILLDNKAKFIKSALLKSRQSSYKFFYFKISSPVSISVAIFTLIIINIVYLKKL